jgi:outer membrane phospholipase A
MKFTSTPNTNEAIQRTFQNETWDLQVLNLYGFDQNDGSLQNQLGYMIESNVRLWVGADVFYGRSPNFFGQFEKINRITFGSSIGF